MKQKSGDIGQLSTLLIRILTCSCVARGGRAITYPTGLKRMQNNTFLVLLRPSFAPKMKTAPPTGLGSRKCKELAVIWTRKVEFFVCGAHPKLVRRSDWILVKTFFFLGDHLISAGKNVSSLVKTFLLEITWFWQKKRLNLIQGW